MNETIHPRQLCALGFCAFTVPAIFLLPRVGWFWALLTAAVTALVIAAVALLRRRCGQGLSEALGKHPVGKVLLILTLVWQLLALGYFGRLLCGSYPEGDTFPLVGLLLLLLASFAAAKGTAVPARVGAISFFFLIIIYGIVLAFGVPQVRVQWLAPVTQPQWALLPLSLAPVCAFYAADRCTDGGKLLRWLLGGLVLAAAAAAVTAGRLSPAIAAAEPFPFYTMTKGISVFGTMERFEALISAAMTAGGFCLLGLLCMASTRIMGAVHSKLRVVAAPVNFFVGGAAIWVSAWIPETVFAVGTAIFWGVVPVSALFLARRKKV